MNKTYLATHVFSLVALFCLGNTIISIPFYNESSPFVSLFVNWGLALLLTCGASAFVTHVYNRRFLFFAFLIFVIAIAVYSAAITSYEYLSFLKNVQLPDAGMAFLCLAVALVVGMLVVARLDVIFKFSLLSFFVCVCFLLLVFLGGIKTFDLSCVRPNVQNASIKFDIGIFLNDFLSLVCPITLIFLHQKNTATKTVLSGILLGFMLLLLSVFQTICTIGRSANCDFAYFTASSVISTGSLFSRIDGLVYFVFFIAAIIKISVCVKTSIEIVKAFAKRAK